jgi:amidohydrolase
MSDSTGGNSTGIKREAQQALQTAAPALIELSEALHADPETAWQEHRSARRVASLLADHGFAITQQYLGLETAFLATSGSGPVRIGICAEYDALPGLGHACGHNLIAAMSAGAGIALAAVAGQLGLTVEVVGTPAEEGGGGKIELLDRGGFTGLDLAMMAHPAPADAAEANPFAVSHWHVTYRGKAAHAAAFPEEGINAADAFTVAQVAIGLLRQQLPASVRVHGIVTGGGQAPNAIPELTEGRWYVRAETMSELAVAEARVRRCFEAGALATGAELTITTESKPYTEFRANAEASGFYRANAEALGRVFAENDSTARMNRGSTDMANVSQVVPAIHPFIGLACFPVVNHQREFADACVGPVAEQAMRDGATALAWTAIDVAIARQPAG